MDNQEIRNDFLNYQDLYDYEERTGITVEHPNIRNPYTPVTTEHGRTVPLEPEKKVSVQWANEVKIEPVKWLWYPYIVDENINTFGGETGTGKTWNLCAIASAVTNDQQPKDMPGILKRHGNVLYLGGEDGNSGAAARLEKVGADRSKVALVQDRFNCMDGTLEELIDEVDPALIIFDPLLSFIPEQTNFNSYVGSRSVMDYLREIAREKKTSIITVVHPPKRGDYKLLYRFTGSGGTVDASRTATYVGYHPTDKNSRVGIQPKNNITGTEPYVFELDPELGFSWKGSDSEITEKQIIETMRWELNGGSNLDYYSNVIEEVLKANPEGMHMTAAEILKEFSKLVNHQIDSKSFGSALNKEILQQALLRKGITLKKGSRPQGYQKYHIYYSDVKPLYER